MARSNENGNERDQLTDARRLIAHALAILDPMRPLIATATLDLALHQLDRAIAAPDDRHPRALAVPRRSPK